MSANNSTFTNDEWKGSTTLLVTMTALTLLTNGYVLILFAMHRSLQTSFIVYVSSLLWSNIFETLFDLMDIMQYARYHWYFTSTLCNFRIYAQWITGAAVVHSHFIITVNRLWAATFPLHYRNYHSRKIAILLCWLVVIYYHLLICPMLIIDYVYYRPNMDNVTDCDVIFSAQPQYAGFIEIWIYIMPIVIMLLSYPYLLWRRNQVKIFRVPPGHAGALEKREAVSGGQHGFRVLTVLTGSIVVCWTTVKTHWILLGFCGTNLPTLHLVGSALYSVQRIIDPILCVLALEKFRIFCIIAHMQTVIECEVVSSAQPVLRRFLKI
ncbi:uncharacterized protein LOC129602328 [Paramacrobiotus metropolitanus]|uniref:uncharacterized protein LOC129602328 n=1 Tax=Paramacrobiotus metropolitanus TaxID=2943436 RepID=UPI002445BE82|nr:uncharacterized protein LOC129602328 [Paramacrobiotus metropolitanus]